MSKEFKNGSKYFANVEVVLDSIKSINTNNSTKLKTDNEKLMFNMIKSLCTIVDTQNDILKYVVSHDNRAIIDEDSDEYPIGKFVWYDDKECIGVVKKVIDDNFVLVHIITQGVDVTLNKTQI